MMYEEVIRDFADRTRVNLRIIENLSAEGKDAYEVTQLVNSTLGLLVFPQQEYIERIPMIPLDQLQKEGWPIPRICGNFHQVSNLKEFIRYLRNAIAHYNIKFIGDGHGDIRFLRVWNTNPRTGKKTWEAELSVNDLRQITNRFIDLLLERN